jgi:hypothetical protein
LLAKKIIKTILQQPYGSIGQYEVLSAMKQKETDKGFDIVRSLCRSHRSTAFACVCGEDGLSFIWHGFD